MAVDYATLKKGGFMRQKQKNNFSLRLAVVGGNLTAENLQIIAKVAEKYGDGHVHLTSRQSVEIPFIKLDDVEEVKEVLATGGCKPGVCGPRVRTITACQGSAVCPSGNIDSYDIAKKLDERYFARELPHKFKFGVTGCQNNCLKAEENDVGIKGASIVEWEEAACINCGICEKTCRVDAISTVLVRPLELGADIVINSTSKYINGNSSAISGVITDAGRFKWDLERYPGMKDYKKFAKFAFTAKLRNGLFRNMGACMAPQTAYYNLLGMETLGLRMERACDNAMQLAAYLETIPGISVNYPGLASSPWNGVAKQLLDGRFGAILTIRVGSKERAFAIMNALTIPQIVSNIGDTKTLIVHPESTLAAHSTEQEKIDAAVFDDMIRISVGIEDIEDLKQDFTAAIQNTAG